MSYSIEIPTIQQQLGDGESMKQKFKWSSFVEE